MHMLKSRLRVRGCVLSLVPTSRTNTSWFLAVDRNKATGNEALIAVAATVNQTLYGYEHAALWFRVRLQQSCRNV